MLGWIGSLLLAVCGLPQAVKSYREKNSDGISWGFITLWTLGEIFTLIYILNDAFAWPLVCNYEIRLIRQKTALEKIADNWRPN